ncbi:MAG: HlyC/CorC family transporter [Actinomycetia bacterium]|nr:HlyC/CorC family transporter [Actinomycetes bacterium]
MSIFVGLLIVIVLVVASGFFVAVEFSLIAADRSKLERLADQGRWSAKSAVRAVKRLSFHLSGAQLGITMVSLLLGFLAEADDGKLLDSVVPGDIANSNLTIVVTLLLATVFQMVAGELIPKNIAISHPEATAQALSPVATIVHGALAPIILLFNGSANWLVRRFGVEPKEEMEAHRSLDDLEYLIRSSGDSGALDPDSHELLTRTLRFGDKTAADALTPRVHMRAVSASATVNELAVEVASSHHSRYPVYDGELDNVRGIATINGIFETPVRRRGEVTVGEIMTQALFVPETRDLVDILDDFRASVGQMAVVIDEHGGTAGILTLEDVLEEIVGDVDDEHDEAQPLTGGVADGVFLLAGTLHPDEVAEHSELVIPPGDYETLAGFVLQRLGRIPAEGDAVRFDGWTIEVAEMDRLRVASLQLRAPTSSPGDR